MSYSIDTLTNNCYEGTTCLINKLDIRDAKQLDIVESQITVAKISILQQNPINGNFDFEHYIDDFVDKMTDFYCVTNNLHPFREGNGRTQRVFLSQLALNAGYEMDFANMDTDELMVATIQAANGVDICLKMY